MRALTHTTYERTSFAFVFPAGPRLPLSVLDGRDFGLGQFCPRLLQGSPVVLDKSRSPSRSLCTGSTAESLCRPLSYSAKCQFLSCTPQQRAHVFALGHFLNTTIAMLTDFTTQITTCLTPLLLEKMLRICFIVSWRPEHGSSEGATRVSAWTWGRPKPSSWHAQGTRAVLTRRRSLRLQLHGGSARTCRGLRRWTSQGASQRLRLQRAPRTRPR